MCANGPQQLLKTSKFYSRSKKCDIQKTLGVGTTPLVARRLTSSARNRLLTYDTSCKLIDNAPVQRARKLIEDPNGLNGLIGQSPKRPVTLALRAHTTALRSRGLQIGVQLKHTLTFPPFLLWD